MEDMSQSNTLERLKHSPTLLESQNQNQSAAENLNDRIEILSPNAHNLTQDQRDRLLEMARLMFEEEFKDWVKQKTVR